MNHRRVTAVALASIAMATLCAPRDAAAITLKGFLGNWCSATARLSFSPNQMGVFLFSDKSQTNHRVTGYDVTDTVVTAHWYKDKELTSSTFSEFSADGHTMFLQPSDKVPRREYKRCSS